ncbi:fumarate hydratase C-terminal domain-containing protein [candidate division KSB1 bacterium]|nr:fumarate hydratase C-terminal domain-containing protein [candidate division KSB1 bacterium]
MKKIIHISTPLSDATIKKLRAGNNVRISGIVYTARDAAHKKLTELLEKKTQLPFDLNGQLIYYVGPTPAKPGQVTGSAGPTTSSRMNKFAPLLLSFGLKGMIGKGEMDSGVTEALKKYCGVYFTATGGAAALIAHCITKMELLAYPELGPEAIYRLTVEDFPCFVAQDCYGGNIYMNRIKYQI